MTVNDHIDNALSADAGVADVDAVEAQGSQAPVQTDNAESDDGSSDALSTAPGMMWYVLRVASNKEDKVRATLERKVKIEGLDDRIGRILVPTLKEKRMKRGVLEVAERKLYPGYVFVEMACEEDGSIADNVWFLVKETTGVGDFIGSDGKPTSMPERDVEQMLLASQQSDDDAGLSGLKISPGDQIKIMDGAFEGYEGEVDAIDERRGMVAVNVAIFGRMTPVEVGYWQIEKVEE